MGGEVQCYEELKELRRVYDAGHLETLREIGRSEDRLTARLQEGTTRMDGLDSRIRAIETESDTHPALPAVSAPAPAHSADASGKLPWYLVAALTAVITTVGPQLWNAGIDFLFHLQHGAKP